MALSHVALTVSDRGRSAAFYGEHFGLTHVLYDDDHLLILGGADGSELALSVGDAVATVLPRTNHFGFRVSDPHAVLAARVRLADAGVQEVEWQDDENYVRLQVLDPDGYRVEIYAPRRPSV